MLCPPLILALATTHKVLQSDGAMRFGLFGK